MTFDPHLEVAIQAAQKAGEYLKQHFHHKHSLRSKSHINDLVTECDIKAEELIKSHLKQNLPHASFLCEESGLSGEDSPLTWIIDPLDGTVNFAKKIPFFSVSIALKRQEEILLGVIYSPMTEELFYAERSKGAFCNHEAIHVSNTANLEKAFGATGFPYRVQDALKASIKPVERLLSLGVPLRRLGSAALDLAYTACGKFDVFFESRLEPWDFAAGALIVEEAGGMISDFQKNKLPYTKSSSVCASNKQLHEAMMSEVLKTC